MGTYPLEVCKDGAELRSIRAGRSSHTFIALVWKRDVSHTRVWRSCEIYRGRWLGDDSFVRGRG